MVQKNTVHSSTGFYLTYFVSMPLAALVFPSLSTRPQERDLETDIESSVINLMNNFCTTNFFFPHSSVRKTKGLLLEIIGIICSFPNV